MHTHIRAALLLLLLLLYTTSASCRGHTAQDLQQKQCLFLVHCCKVWFYG